MAYMLYVTVPDDQPVGKSHVLTPPPPSTPPPFLLEADLSPTTPQRPLSSSGRRRRWEMLTMFAIPWRCLVPEHQKGKKREKSLAYCHSSCGSFRFRVTPLTGSTCSPLPLNLLQEPKYCVRNPSLPPPPSSPHGRLPRLQFLAVCLGDEYEST